MATQVIPYGGAELKRVMHRYWLYGFAISVVIHLGILATQQLAKGVGPMSSPPPNGQGGNHTVQVELPPYVPWFPTSPPPSGPATKIKGERGIPVPVGSELVDPDRTIESHGPSGDLSNPTGNGTGEGIGETHGGALEFPEEPPLPFTPVEVDAKVIRSVLPVYPEIARRSGLEGRVFVRIWVDKEGKCRKVEVLRSTADIFNDAAVEAAKQFLFTPAYMNSGPVSVWVAIPFLFTLKSN